MESGDKPFRCSSCGQCFANNDHLAVHQLNHLKEQKSLQVKIPGVGNLKTDQTPTPTRFLRTGEVDGSQLFDDINPFDQDFGRVASKRHPAPPEQNQSVHSTAEDYYQRHAKRMPADMSIRDERSSISDMNRHTDFRKDLDSHEKSQSVSVISSADERSMPESSNAVIQAVLRQLENAKQLDTPNSDLSNDSSQETLREQLKSLLRAGQIKIQITGDNADPKQQQQRSQSTPTTPNLGTTLFKAVTVTPQGTILTPVTAVPGLTSTNMVYSDGKQKLKDSFNSSLEGYRASMINVNSQGKYKDINLENKPDPLEGYEILGGKRKGRPESELTPEEKRSKFLERNRAAASRCRQKRKVWVSQLERKSDDLVHTNSQLMNEITNLRNEVAQLKALLLAHKDCPVTMQQKALLGQIQSSGYITLADGQVIAIHPVSSAGNNVTPTTAEQVATSALTDMASRDPNNRNNTMTVNSTVVSSIASHMVHNR